ncbi:hypothetical protein [Salinimicrobium xinjiangense]|uniref:hypothetical protein n=1 Tax=Salinimicrobium xinjiangense TaxID=438596 RepID=UPI0003F75E99|nr:hypothetical protein [Salinimicrobium xinjiangense]
MYLTITTILISMFHIKPGKVFITLLSIIFFLLLLNIASYLILYFENGHPEDFFFRKTNFNMEKNLPSIFSGILHFASSILLLLIGRKVVRNKSFWFFLSFLFLFTGLDEILRLHEKMGKSISHTIETSSIFLFSWVIPYGIAAIIIAVIIFKPLFSLDKGTIRSFLLSALLFLSGAVGVEMFTGWYIEYYQLDLTRLLVIPDAFILSTIEELLEMLGLSYFIYSLLVFKMKHNI